MGYTITIRPRSSALAQKMLSFCKDHLRPLPKIIEDPNMWDIKGPLPAPRLSYCKRPTHIGFDYGPSSIEREWCYSLLQWMAVKVGVRKKGFPCYLYDGHDWVILDPKKFDELGQERPEHQRKHLLWPSMKKITKRFTAEIQHLDKLWDSFQKPEKEETKDANEII